MSLEPTIDALKAEGVCLFDIDLRERCFKDSSANNQDIIAALMRFTGRSAVLAATGGGLTILDDPILRGDEFALVLFGYFGVSSTDARFMSKRDVGGTNYDWSGFVAGAETLSVYDGATQRLLSTQISGKRCHALNMKDGEIPEGFTEGLSVGSYTGAVALSADDADITIANNFTSTKPLDNTELQTAMKFSRELTGPEHLLVYNELKARKHNIRPRLIHGVCSMIDWGINESVAAITSGPLENSGFDVKSGSAKVALNEINGETVKNMLGVSTSVVFMPVELLRQTYAQAAYGVWEWYMSKTDTSTLVFQIISDGVDASAGATNNYNLLWAANDEITLRKSAGAAIIAGGDIGFGMVKIKVTRTIAGLFSLYANDVLLGTGTNNTITESKFIVGSNMPPDSEIVLAAKSGIPNFRKDKL